jgi:hypothetical protein
VFLSQNQFRHRPNVIRNSRFYCRCRVGFWPIGTRYSEWRDPNNCHVFVRYDPKVDGLEAFLESSNAVAQCVARDQQAEKMRGVKAWAPCYYPQSELERLRLQWEEFGRSTN